MYFFAIQKHHTQGSHVGICILPEVGVAQRVAPQETDSRFYLHVFCGCTVGPEEKLKPQPLFLGHLSPLLLDPICGCPIPKLLGPGLQDGAQTVGSSNPIKRQLDQVILSSFCCTRSPGHCTGLATQECNPGTVGSSLQPQMMLSNETCWWTQMEAVILCRSNPRLEFALDHPKNNQATKHRGQFGQGIVQHSHCFRTNP